MHLLLILIFTCLQLCAFGQWQRAERPSAIGNQFINPLLAPFYHGVASGDPLSDAVVIWTRYTPADSSMEAVSIMWEVAEQMDFATIVQSGVFETDATRDFTVKVDVTGLSPDTYYYYRFKADTALSLTGRTKTAPTSASSRIRMAAVSCSDYKEGYFHAYRKLSERNDLSLILHLGDYIYEQGGGEPGRVHEPDAEIYRLVDYRQRYSQYHLDPDLLRCHQVHPFATIWDDHDLVVDAVTDTSLRHYPQFGLYRDRKRAAIRAAREWLPIRDPDTLQASFFKNWRILPYGDLLDVLMIDVRLYDRDLFATDANDPLYSDTNAHILGPEQFDWLTTSLSNSPAKWKLIGNQLMLSQFRALDPTPLIFENWDGYPHERNRFFDHLEDNAIDNVIFTTGDFHVSMATDVARNPTDLQQYNPISGDGSLLVEFIVPSITGGNLDEGGVDLGPLNGQSPAVVENLIPLANPHIKEVELTSHGYLLLDIDQQRVQGEFWYVSDVNNPGVPTEAFSSAWTALDGANKLSSGNGITAPITGLPPFPGTLPGDTASMTGIVGTQAAPVVISVFPNPFTTDTYVNYVLPNTQHVNLGLYSVEGRLIKQEYATMQPSGNYLARISGQGLDPGMYLLRLSSDSGVLVRRIIKY